VRRQRASHGPWVKRHPRRSLLMSEEDVFGLYVGRSPVGILAAVLPFATVLAVTGVILVLPFATVLAVTGVILVAGRGRWADGTEATEWQTPGPRGEEEGAATRAVSETTSVSLVSRSSLRVSIERALENVCIEASTLKKRREQW
jgi:hypothetical protein